MEIKKETIKERIKEAKDYGLTYAQLARELNIQPVTIYMFMSGNSNLSKINTLKILCYIEKYIEQVKEQIRIIEQKGVAING